MSSRDQAGGGSAETSSSSADPTGKPAPRVRPVSSRAEAYRVFGRVDVRKPATNNLRQRTTDKLALRYAKEIQQIRSHRQRQLAIWSKSPGGRKLKWEQLPSVLCVSPQARQFALDFELIWTRDHRVEMANYSLTVIAARPKNALGGYIDAMIDLYRLCEDHLSILKLFVDLFAQESPSRLSTTNSMCIYFFLRLPRADHAIIMELMNKININDLQDHIYTHEPNEWTAFHSAMTREHLLYEQLHAEYSNGSHPPGKDHSIEFESQEEYESPSRATPPAFVDPDLGGKFDTAWLSGHDTSKFGYPAEIPRIDPDTWSRPHAESDYAMDALGTNATYQIDYLMYLHPRILLHEILAAVIKPTPSSLFIGSSSFDRLYYVLQLVDVRVFMIYFEEFAAFEQFSSLIRWALWQIFHWDNVWYRFAVYDDVLLETLERTIKYNPPSNSQTSFSTDEEREQHETRARKYRIREYIGRQFAFQSHLGFEDVVASVPWANTIQATRQAVLASFPPEVVRRQYNLTQDDKATSNLMVAFRHVWKQNMSPAHARDARKDGNSANIGYLVSHVLRTLTLMQIIENTDHVATDALSFLLPLTWWQFNGPPKVNILKYAIQHMRPNDAAVADMFNERANGQMKSEHDSDNVYAKSFLLPSFTPVKLQAAFVSYAKWLKRRDNLAAPLMTSGVVPALIDGANKTMPSAVTLNKSGEQKIKDKKALNPSDYDYSTVTKHIKVPTEVLYTKILGEFLGLKLSHGGATGTMRIVTPTEYFSLHPQYRVANGIDPRKQDAFIFQPYQPLYVPVRSNVKQPSENTATIRHAPDAAVVGESTSAPPPSKRSK